MANGIASVELVIALGKEGFLCSFGAAGLVPDVVEESIRRLQAELPNGPYAVNVIHAPADRKSVVKGKSEDHGCLGLLKVKRQQCKIQTQV